MNRKKQPKPKQKDEKSLAVIPLQKQEVSIWSKTDEIRKLFAPTLTEIEWNLFLGLGRSLNANPFLREIWAIKYDTSKAASIFLGRDMYRRRGQEQPNYDGHLVNAVYENDKFEMVDGEPHHTFNLKGRGKLLAAYCIVRKKGIRQPYLVTVKFEEYDKGFSNWKSMPETMLKKVAEAQAMRGAFQGIFAGTYDESEQWEEEKKTKVKPTEIDTHLPDYLEAAIKKIKEAGTPDQAIDIETRAKGWGEFSNEQLAQINTAVNTRVDQLMGAAS